MPKLAKHIEDQLLAENPEFRAKGLRPTVVWVQDTDEQDFRQAWDRQMEAICDSPEEAKILDWIEAVYEWPKD